MKKASEPVLFRVHFTDLRGTRHTDDFMAESPDQAVETLRQSRPDEKLAVTKVKRVRT